MNDAKTIVMWQRKDATDGVTTQAVVGALETMPDQDLKISSVLEAVLMDYAGLQKPIAPHSRAVKQLAAAVKTISDEYIAANDRFTGDLFKNAALINAYLIYFLPANLVKLFPVLDELVSHPDINGLSGPDISILDLGCGPGTFLLGVLEYFCARRKNIFSPDVERIDLWGIDRSEACLATARHVINHYLQASVLPAHSTCGLHFKVGSLSSTMFPHPLLPARRAFDLIIAGNVLTEMEQSECRKLVPIFERLLSPRGALLLIEPGTKTASRHLTSIRNMLLEQTSLTLYAPCLESGPCPSFDNPQDWCHQKLFWSPPEIIRAIDRITGFTKHKGIHFTYFTFLKDGKQVVYPAGDFRRDQIWRVVSYVIKGTGEERLYICNGKERIMLRRLDRNATVHNQDFSRARRGDRVIVAGMVKRETFYEVGKNTRFTVLRQEHGT